MTEAMKLFFQRLLTVLACIVGGAFALFFGLLLLGALRAQALWFVPILACIRCGDE
jgi:hypothetical protein